MFDDRQEGPHPSRANRAARRAGRLEVVVGGLGAAISLMSCAASLGAVTVSRRGELEREIEVDLLRDEQIVDALLQGRRAALDATAAAMASAPRVRHALGAGTLDPDAYRRIADEQRTSTGVDLVALLGPDGRVLATSPADQTVRVALGPDASTPLAWVGSAPYVESTSPVEVGGRTLGWLVAGDALDTAFVGAAADLTGQEVVLRVGEAVAGQELRETRARVLGLGPAAEVVLMRDDDARITASRGGIGWLVGVGLVTSALGALASVGVARKVAAPLRGVTRVVERVARGEIDPGPGLDLADASRIEEARALAGAFRSMVATLLDRRERATEAHRAELEANRVLEAEIQRARGVAELEDVRDRALAVSRAKSIFLADMSHELRAQLDAVVGYTELLAEDPDLADRDEVLRDLDSVRAAGRRLSSLIGDVLDLAEIDAGRARTDLASVEVVELVQEVADTVRPLFGRSGSVFEVEAPADLPVVLADRCKLIQVLVKLLENAANLTDGGRVRLTAVWAGSEGRGLLTFTVSEDGIGMTGQELARVFEDYAQADGGTSRNLGGAGLGLALGRRLTSIMGGELSAVSEPGSGSTFTLTLPVGLLARESVRTPAPPPARASRGGVLVVEDDPAVLSLTSRHLCLAGWSVETCDAHEALAVARATSPSVICIDAGRRGADGFWLLRAIKGDPELARIEVIVVTLKAERARGMALGAAEVLVKPVARTHLLSVVRALTTGRDVPAPRDVRDPSPREGAPEIMSEPDSLFPITLLSTPLFSGRRPDDGGWVGLAH